MNWLSNFQINWRKFRTFRRGYWSFWLLVFIVSFAATAELWINNRAWIVVYEGQYFFPVFHGFYSEKTFGGQEEYEVKYRELKKRFDQEQTANFVILAPFPFNPQESDFQPGADPPPHPPFYNQHLLGTDTLGRDIFARLIYAFRLTFIFALLLYAINTLTGIFLGSLMGYLGGWFDLLFQRFIEIWSNLPLLYLLIILGSILTPSLGMLLLIFALFNWTAITWLIRAEVFREKNRTYALNAKSLGLHWFAILCRHIIPNCLVPVFVNLPFAMIGGISVLTSLDYLGYGLPIPTPSWGEMLKQGQQTFEYAPWIVFAPAVATVFTLLLFSFIGESLRDCFDAKKNSFYR